jgi:hypothetical protein
VLGLEDLAHPAFARSSVRAAVGSKTAEGRVACSESCQLGCCVLFLVCPARARPAARGLMAEVSICAGRRGPSALGGALAYAGLGWMWRPQIKWAK